MTLYIVLISHQRKTKSSVIPPHSSLKPVEILRGMAAGDEGRLQPWYIDCNRAALTHMGTLHEGRVWYNIRRTPQQPLSHLHLSFLSPPLWCAPHYLHVRQSAWKKIVIALFTIDSPALCSCRWEKANFSSSHMRRVLALETHRCADSSWERVRGVVLFLASRKSCC